MPTYLKNLKLEELSFVDKGANQHARVTIFKRAKPAGGDAGDDTGNDEETTMPVDEKKVAELEKQVADLTASVTKANEASEALKKELEAATAAKAAADAIAKLSDVEKAHYATLKGDDDKKMFLEMSEDDRKKATKKAADADEVVKIEGQEIRKSVVGEATFTVMKSQAERIAKAEDDIKKAREEGEMATLRKRADDQYGHVPGTTDERASMLREIGKMDKETQALFEKVFEQSEKLAKSAFGTFGTAAGGELTADVKKAADTFVAKVEEIRKAKNISRTAALESARKEFPEEFKAYQKAGAVEAPPPARNSN